MMHSETFVSETVIRTKENKLKRKLKNFEKSRFDCQKKKELREMKFEQDEILKEINCPSEQCEFVVKDRIQIILHLVERHSLIVENAEEKLFVCSICKKCFKRKGSLKRHMELHVGIKLFECHQCGRSFFQKSNLDVHSRLHDSDKSKRFECEVCFRQYSHARSLRHHRWSVHNLSKNDKPNFDKADQPTQNENPFQTTGFQKHFRQFTFYPGTIFQGYSFPQQMANNRVLNAAIPYENISTISSLFKTPSYGSNAKGFKTNETPKKET